MTDSDKLQNSAAYGSDSDSDDAPVEESFGNSAKAVKEQQKAREKLVAQQKKQTREQRRKLDEQLKAQRRLADKKTKPVTEKFEDSDSDDDDNSELPQSLLESVAESLKNRPTVPQKITFSDSEETSSSYKVSERSLRISKKPLSVRKGPVRVALLTSTTKTLPPKAEKRVVGRKEKWLSRRSLRK